MRLWRLSSVRRARDFDGGYGLSNDGRWNTRGRPVTYCATVPSLAILEKRVHVSDVGLLPPQALVEYHVPDDLPSLEMRIDRLPADWRRRQAHTQMLGDEWLDKTAQAMLIVPSVIVPIGGAPDRNVLINHRYPEVARIAITAVTLLRLDPRLFQP
jgi:RES domain-containing protein